MYWFLDARKQVLYVGKAKILRQRLWSYTHTNQILPKTNKMLQLATMTRYLEVDSELDALLLEAELIRAYQPPYNVLLKDDKSPLYIAITKEPYPKILAVRKGNISSADKKTFLHLYGPYQSSTKVRQLLKLLRKLFPYCNAKRGQHRACMYHHLGLCPGVCVDAISQSTYAQTIDAIHLFLTGRRHQLKQKLIREIKELSDLEAYEAAAKIKTQFEAMTYIISHYKEKDQSMVLPNLSQDIGIDRMIHLRRLLSKHYALPSDYPLNRVECYDVSNIDGKFATVSMVVFTNGLRDPKSYKKFRIKTLNSPNDVGMLKEALKRRLNHEDWGFPNLVVIDGGRGQVRAARQVISWTIPVVSIAKHPDRLIIPIIANTNSNQIPTFQDTINFAIETLNPRDSGAHLIQALRDESHRFAKTYHQKLLAKEYIAKSV